MKISPEVPRLTLAILALMLVLSLAGCASTATTPAAVDTVGVPTEAPPPATPTSAPPTQPPTSPPPSATPLPPTLPAPTETPPPAPTLPPAATEAGPTAPSVSNLPVDGVWTGGGTKLLIDFTIQTSDGTNTISNVGIVWQGHNECDLNGRFNISAPLNDNGFVLNYNSDEVTFILSGVPVSSSIIEGVLNLKVEDCGSHQIPWRAIPKTGSTP
jgi:hypothetical protein